MTLRLDAETRARVRELERAKKAALKPAKEAQREQRQAERKARPKREKRVEHENAKPNRGREREPLFLAYLRRQPCEAAHLGGCAGPIEAAHVRYSDAARGIFNPGLQRRNHDRHANPLCRFHHQHDQHKRQERAFWDRLGIEPGALSIALHDAYRAGKDGLGVLQQFTRKDAA